MSEDKSIKFPEKHYIGFQKRSEDALPLAFMTPDGDDSTALKRKATVDRWAGDSKIESITYENNPLPGFRLVRNIKHGYGWGQGNVKWRIEDPRGFELEITSPNLSQLLNYCEIKQGDIQEDCIWARSGNENILVPVNSDVYKAALANTARSKKIASLKDLKLGDVVVLQNGYEGTFLGSFYFFHFNQWKPGFSCGDKKRFIFKDSTGKQYLTISSPKLAEIIPGDKSLTQELSEQQINIGLQNGSIYISETSYGKGTVKAVTSKKPSLSDVTIYSEQLDFVAASQADKGVFFFDRNGNHYLFDMAQYHLVCKNNRNGVDKVWIYQYDKLAIANNSFVRLDQQCRTSGYAYGYQNPHVDHTNMPTTVTKYTVRAKTTYSGEVVLN